MSQSNFTEPIERLSSKTYKWTSPDKKGTYKLGMVLDYKGNKETLTLGTVDVITDLRMTIRKFFKKGIVKNPHVYKKED